MRLLSIATSLAAAIFIFGAKPGVAYAAGGEDVFNKYCAVCHATQPGINKTGPSLAGLIGRKAGGVSAFPYSPAMLKSGLTWDLPTMDQFLTNPKALVPANKMTFVGIKRAVDRAALIEFLSTL